VTFVSEGLLAVEYGINIGRQSVPFLTTIFPQQVVGLTEFFLAIALLLILTLRPSGIMKGQEFKWPFGDPPVPEVAARRASAAEAASASSQSETAKS
jgi:hypothetical protein